MSDYTIDSMVTITGAEYERMRAENEKLRVVLRETVAWADRHGKDPDWLDAALAALAEEKPNDR